MRENVEERHILGIGSFPLPKLCPHTRRYCAVTENLQSSLDWRVGVAMAITSHPPPTNYPSVVPTTAVYDQQSVTPTFQVDDLHCIVDARARDGPHLDTPERPSSLPPPHAQGDAAARWRGSKRTVACHYLRLKIVWLVTVNFWGADVRGVVFWLHCRGCFFFFPSPSNRGDVFEPLIRLTEGSLSTPLRVTAY